MADALDKVESQIAAAESEAEACQMKARKQLAAGKRTAAAAYLRSKKQLDDVVGKRVAAGEQLRSVHRALNQAKGDAEVSPSPAAQRSGVFRRVWVAAAARLVWHINVVDDGQPSLPLLTSLCKVWR